MAKVTKEAALRYHSEGRPGKIEVIPTKPYSTQTDLSLAYSPGVAEPCLEIEKNPQDAYKYTAKGNLVAVISNGTAVLGLGDIGALSGKPVMEGKGLLFKIYAGIDVFDIEVDEKDPEKFIAAVKAIAPTFGGINLEDIKAPECFEIERRLKEELDIPVMHDDQHGTAIVASAAMLNAAKVAGKKIHDMTLVINGAGAAGIAIAKQFITLGIGNIIMVDIKGIICDGDEFDNPSHYEIAKVTNKNKIKGGLAEAMKNADAFIGVSKPGLVSEEMVKSMADKPIIFAMANPTPEIMPEAAKSAGAFVVGTGRSDYPNQINNVVAFPGVFKGALAVRAKDINEDMKLAAAYAIADSVDESKLNADNILPDPFDRNIPKAVAKAVAEAAIKSGTARKKEFDI